MPYDIFISYSRANSTSLAHYLYEALTHQGWSVFMDVRKQDGGGRSQSDYAWQLKKAVW